MAAIAFTLLRLTTAPTAAGLAAVGLALFLVTLVQVPESSVAQVQDAQRAAKAKPSFSMHRCMATWDRSAQMSRQEWKERANGSSGTTRAYMANLSELSHDILRDRRRFAG